MNSSKKILLEWYQELGIDYFMNEIPQDRSITQQKITKNEFNKNVYLKNSKLNCQKSMDGWMKIMCICQ